MITLIYHNDPGHGWLAVHGDLLRALIAPLKVSETVSGHSFYHKQSDTFYLEEDCDAVHAMKPLRDGDYEHKIESKYAENCFVRCQKYLGDFPAEVLDRVRDQAPEEDSIH